MSLVDLTFSSCAVVLGLALTKSPQRRADCWLRRDASVWFYGPSFHALLVFAVLLATTSSFPADND